MSTRIKSAGIIVVCCLILATTEIICGQLHEKYIGCFVENGNNQRTETVLRNKSNLTIEICIQKCYNETNQTKSMMTFAAVNNGRRCKCRNNPGQQLNDKVCNVKCSGASTQNCGGNQTDNVYSLYTVCPVGYFGPICKQLCHCNRHLPCDRRTGICPDGCDEKWIGRSCNRSNSQKQYIGCYGDGNNQAMNEKNPGGKPPSNSVEACIDICSTKKYTYAGMQYGADCHCGEKYDSYGNKTHTASIQVICNYTCPANRSQMCGGNYANSVYYVCPLGFYGRNCVNRCHCSDGGPCRSNGSCLTSALSSCKPGWTGSVCTVRDCGTNNGDCDSDEKCEIVDLGFANMSVCRCKDGLYRDNKNLSMCRCKDGFYRDNNTCRPTHLHYVGCYKGNITQHAGVELPTSETLTIEFCIQRCRQLNSTYSVTQAGVTCFCGDDYGQAIPDAECQVPCAGNKLQYCGGKNTADGTPIYAVYTANSFLRRYIGCYNDSAIRAMEKEFKWLNARNNTIDSCIRQCGLHNYTYAGLQYRSECYCGNSYDKYGPLPESSCIEICSGNNSQICGGGWANSVYAVNDIFWCSNDTNCRRKEACNVIDLNYMNVSRCRCIQGFHRMSTWEYCTDVDECKSGTSTCNSTSEICFNNIGSYRCECKGGFINISGNCEDIDECRNGPFECEEATELCKNTVGSYLCQCKPGYENTTFGNCTDVDECESGNSTCNLFSENCVNIIGSYICKCKSGFVKISGNCEDSDECRNGSHVCDIETELCNNTVGSYLCYCKPGYKNMTNCTDIDECESNNSTCNLYSENCVNNIGSYRCECQSGFVNINGKCEAHLHYVGCYNGNTTEYVAVELPTSDTLTIEFCIQKCKQLNKTYSIIQGGVKCFCGGDYGQALPDAECQVPCAGNKLQYCGGNNTTNGTPIYVVYTAWITDWFLRQYIGCYKDNSTAAMEEKFSWENAGNNTVESCTRHCTFHNYTYAGLQFGYQCFCGNTYDRYGYGPIPESSCNMTCSDNSSEICGGEFANSVYAGSDILRCSTDSDCNWIESCNVINLKYMNVSRCRCKQGFHRMSTWGNCTDVDECQSGTSTCNTTSENCVNNIGSYRCECKDGFVNISGNCEDIDECSNGLLLCDNETELCKNTIGGYICQCKPGYENTTFGNCTDIDECQSDDSVCNPTTEKCINNIGSYRCDCKDGFTNKSRHCVDVDECQSGNSTCSTTTENCANNIGSYSCDCKDGFVKMSGKCEDNDECRNGPVVCDTETELCKNTIGSYTCHCKAGYKNTTFDNCTDVDECSFGTASACNPISENCTNNIGSYSCECKDGFVKITGVCEDVDECKWGNSTCNLFSEKCINDIGSYSCECKNGFLNTSEKCEDIDECQLGTSTCNLISENCTNNIGSFSCECKDGFTNGSRYCEDVDECRLKSDKCDNSSEHCVNSIGSFICTCKESFTKRSGKCESRPMSYEQNGAVVMLLGCLLVVITIATLVSVCLLRKRIFVRKENSGSAVVDGHSKSKERKAAGEYKETFVPLILMNHNNHKIPVGELPALFKTKKSDPGTLEAEFQSVPEVDSTKTCLEGRKKELKHRNRFMNIIPYDQNRVILLKQHKQFSDYINASFIKSYNSQEKLIATQGPTPDTLTHFWQMIHENNVGTVVMITNLIENGKKKCARYWPEYDGTMTFEDMTITLKLTETWPNYVIRHLQLIKGKITMEVKQWHFTVWPDHGVPSDVKGFLNFRRNVRQSMSLDKYTVVHCSAGVGRTGTFIAINYLLEQAEAEGMVDIVECLKLLRQQRTQMVQTLDQYEFIYAALATEFAIGKTIISAKDFDRTFRDLLVQNKLSGKTQLEIQFQVLQEQWAQKSDSANPFHVFAKSLDMSESSDFVQAVFVQSWKTKDAYIVPEYPEKATVNYFWTICLDYECKLVINLDNGQNSEPFFPKQQGESLCVDNWRLQCKSSENERYLTRLNVALTQFSESEYANTAVSTASGEVTLLNVKAYVNDTRLNYDAIHATCDAMKTFQSKNDAKKSANPVVIVSRPNCILNGLFIAAFNAFDMLEEAKEVDLYQVSYDIKKSRSQFIPSLAAFEELHNIVNHRIGYTSPAAIYGNV